MQDDLTAWLTLTHAAAATEMNLAPLVAAYGGAAGLLEGVAGDAALRAALPGAVRRDLLAPRRERLAADRAWLEKPGNRYVTCLDEAYPAPLKNIAHPPPLLFFQGDAALLGRAQLAVVGSRKPSAYGRGVAERLAAELGDYGLLVTSGLASGIDTAAHKGALRGEATTVAVLGHGFGYLYPVANRRLAEQIAAEGALISEFPAGRPPRAGNFPRRNRIISGLSKGVLVVEAALRSGSLITARHALEQGREVFAVPGSINNAMARGCHKLIQDGAKLAQEAGDIAEELGLERLAPPAAEDKAAEKKPRQVENQGATRGATRSETRSAIRDETRNENNDANRLDESDKALLDHIGCDPVSVDELYLATRMDIDRLTEKLLRLELAGHVTAVAAGIYTRN